jgi:hypothetical protein
MGKILTAIVVIIIIILLVVVGVQIVPSHKINIQYGFSIHGLSDYQANLINNSGATWVRSDVGSATWTQIYNTAVNYHFKILGILDYDSVPHNFTLQQWNQTVTEDVTTYSSVTAWEIWNEPDLSYSWDGYLTSNPATYFNMVKAAYEIVHRYKPNELIIGFGGYNPPITEYELNWGNTLISMGISHYTNALSLHLYPFLAQNNTQVAINEYDAFISSLKAQTNEPLWVTETGAIQSEQTAYIPEVFNMLLKLGITHIFWYDLIHNNNPYNTALLNNLQQPTAGYYAFQNFTEENR